jgi:hypothetical protein
MRTKFAAVVLILLGVGLFPSSQASADLIAYWNFNALVNNTNNGNIYGADTGSGVIFLDGWDSEGPNAKAGTTINALGGDPAGQALGLESDANNGASMVFFFNMAGLIDPILTFAERRNEFGFDSIQASWSTDGVTFTDFGSPFVSPTGVFGLRVLDFSSINALDGALNAFIKLTFDGATERFGKNRIDNPQINASTAIPEPSYMAATGAVLALVFVIGLRRRNRNASTG